MNLTYKQLSLNESLRILERNSFCHIALSNNNKPYIVPINYKFINNNSDYSVEILSLIKCKKMDIISNNNFVIINVVEAANNSMSSVIGYGRVIDLKICNDFITKINIKIDYVTGRIISNNFK